MLFSRMVERPSQRKIVIDSTAIGIDALTVSPIFSARYTLEAPKMSPSRTPSTMARRVSSAGACDAGTYGWCVAVEAPDAAAGWAAGMLVIGGTICPYNGPGVQQG